MDERVRASLESELGNKPCGVSDTEEIFWLREADDYRSKVALGDALAGQYRFREAIEAYHEALRIKKDDPGLYNRLGGANLTLFRFPAAMAHYQSCLALGMERRALSYSLGVWQYLSGKFEAAAELFEAALPCADELKIAVLYWHTLSCYRAGMTPALLGEYHERMEVGHHTAYEAVVQVFCGRRSWCELAPGENALDAVITLYGLFGYLRHIGEEKRAMECLRAALERDSVWPSIAYLAAWREGEKLGLVESPGVL